MQCLADARNSREEWTILCVTYLVGNDCSKLMTKFVIKSFRKANLGSYLRDHISENGYIDIPACRGGIMFYPPNQLDAVQDALVKYHNKKNGKASVAVVLNYTLGKVRSIPPVYSIELSWLPIVGSVSFFPMTHLFLHSIF